MTLEEVYRILESKIYYDKDGRRKFSFADNAIHIDRRASIPFTIYKENESFFLDPDTAIAGEKELRIEIGTFSENSMAFYGKNSGENLITLE